MYISPELIIFIFSAISDSSNNLMRKIIGQTGFISIARSICQNYGW